MKLNLQFAFCVCLTLLQLSCSTPKALEYRDFQNFRIEKAGLAATAITMDLLYYNPNNASLQLKNTDLQIFIDGNYFGHTVQDQLVKIPAREEFLVPVKIEVDMKNLLRNGLATLVRNEVMVKVTGSIKVGKGNFFQSFPVKYEGKQAFSFF